MADVYIYSIRSPRFRRESLLEHVPMTSNHLSRVMPALVAGIHVFLAALQQARRRWPDKPGHDSGEVVQHDRNPL